MAPNQLNADFSTLVLSIGSAATMSLGVVPNPNTGKVEKNLELAKFNIDLLSVLQEKTKNNLNSEEKQLLGSLISDLQIKFIDAKK